MFNTSPEKTKPQVDQFLGVWFGGNSGFKTISILVPVAVPPVPFGACSECTNTNGQSQSLAIDMHQCHQAIAVYAVAVQVFQRNGLRRRGTATSGDSRQWS
jgi:hypothetical protein